MVGNPTASATCPVLHQSSSYVHAIVITPAELLSACIAFFPRNHSLPHLTAGSASALMLSRPARRSFTLRPAHSPNHQVILYTEGFSRLSLCDCSDCYRLERQLPGGIRTHRKTVPLHGAQQVPLMLGRSVSNGFARYSSSPRSKPRMCMGITASVCDAVVRFLRTDAAI